MRILENKSESLPFRDLGISFAEEVAVSSRHVSVLVIGQQKSPCFQDAVLENVRICKTIDSRYCLQVH